MRCRVFALAVALGLSLSSAALATPQCPVGKINYRSKHICIAKEVAINLGIYRYRRHATAKAGRTTIVHQLARAGAAARAAIIPVPPVRLMRNGTASASAEDEGVESTGSVLAAAPETARRSISPYGALVPVIPAE